MPSAGCSGEAGSDDLGANSYWRRRRQRQPRWAALKQLSAGSSGCVANDPAHLAQARALDQAAALSRAFRAAQCRVADWPAGSADGAACEAHGACEGCYDAAEMLDVAAPKLTGNDAHDMRGRYMRALKVAKSTSTVR